ncbi:MAG: BON domain-containing protein [Gammaproteobacteria bacterium]|nr:BON domain-containing protein [Gammaproteobacteria bacterium]
MNPIFKYILTGLIISLLNGCAGVVVGGAATGIAVVHDRRTTGTVLDDQTIELKASKSFMQDKAISKNSHLNITSYNGIVLLTGEVISAQVRDDIHQIVQALPKVRRIHNQLTIAAPSSLLSRSSDTLITAKAKTHLLSIDGIKDFDLTRIKIITENGVVYLMGLVTRQEADAATESVRQIDGVQRIERMFEYID